MAETTTWVALLRGVNVGKAQRVPMEVLRTLLAEMGCSQVHTLLNSGNAVFQAAVPRTAARAAALAAGLAQALHAQLGLQVPVVVKSAQTLDQIVAGNPLRAADASRLLVAFTQEAAGLQALQALLPLVSPPEALHLGRDAAYLHCANGILESPVAKALLGRLGRHITTRNWATTLKIQAVAASLQR